MQIYCIYCKISGKYYVGKTTQTLQSRWYLHRWDAAHQRSNFHLHNAIRKYGSENFIVWSLTGDLNPPDENQLNILEQLWILTLRSYDPALGYNMTMGGDGGGIPTEETRAKLRKPHPAMRGKKMSPTAVENSRRSHLGYKHTAASRQKMSITRKGKPWSEARRAAGRKYGRTP
jgi:group I intron endonuclease